VDTLQDMVAAIDRALPLCEAVAKDPDDLDARRALTVALAEIADESFLATCDQAAPAHRGLCNFARIQSMLLRDCMTRSDEPKPVVAFMIVSKSRDLLALLPELKKAIDRSAV